ncbi:ribonuclease E inhibitor RraB [Patescibacteria group bacterium]|nr:ribonuclease E inhibitor RraB [Patescibacteria group bacterium]
MQSSLERVLALFVRMTADGWDTAAPLTWAFYFVNSRKAPLLKIGAVLKDHRYTAGSLYQSEDGAWVLQVTKTEALTAENLHRRNQAFNDLAEHCGCELYDGWDVGKAKE